MNAKKYLLARTDGYSIEEVGRYPTLEDAQTAMQEEYDSRDKNEADSEEAEMSSVNDLSAILYDRGFDVYCWQIFKF